MNSNEKKSFNNDRRMMIIVNIIGVFGILIPIFYFGNENALFGAGNYMAAVWIMILVGRNIEVFFPRIDRSPLYKFFYFIILSVVLLLLILRLFSLI